MYWRRPSPSIALPVVVMILSALLVSGCSGKKDDGDISADELPSLTIGEDTPNMMLTWIDERGETHVEMRPSDVPIKGRELVRVVLADRGDGTRDPIYVVDLRRPGADGGYEASSMPRSQWEERIERRRNAYRRETAPPPPVAGPDTPDRPDRPDATGRVAIIYGADWCSPCHDAERYLKSLGVKVIMKDVDRDPSAQGEMRQKLEKAGRSGGSIPVIDIDGQILVGFNKGSIDRALDGASSGGTLL